MSKQTFKEKIQAARVAQTPILAIETTDGIAAERRIVDCLSPKTPFLRWDVIRGITGVNKAGEAAAGTIQTTPSPIIAMEEALNLPKKVIDENEKMIAPGAVLFVHNAHTYIQANADYSPAEFAQALLNLRDKFGETMRTVILLGPAFPLPPQLVQHVTVLDDPLPTADELCVPLKKLCADNKIELDADGERRGAEALLGLSEFAAIDSIANSIRVNGKSTLDYDRLWERKRDLINKTRGLEFWNGSETFENMLGYGEAVGFAKSVGAGRCRPEAIILIDEGEDQAGGSKTDLSGVSQKMMGRLCSEMQDRKYRGQINYGVQGCGKTLFAKAMAGHCQVPLIMLQLAEMEDSLVGNSQANLVAALKTVYTVSNGNPYMILTSNDLTSIPAKLKARFSYGGIWMFDVPTDDEIAALFEFYLKRRGLDDLVPEIAQIDRAGWVPRDVEWCVEKAWDLNLSLKRAAQHVVPYGKANKRDIDAIRQQATGRYLSAAKPGAYRPNEEAAGERTTITASATGRVIEREV